MEERRITIQELGAPPGFAPPSQGGPYVAIVWDCDGSFNVDQQSQVALTLFNTGCRYILCGGVNCNQWHDVADEDWVILHLDTEPAQIPHHMSTWHADESIEEVLSFALQFTEYRDILILIIGQDPHQRQQARLQFQAQP